ncbi:protein kinase C-binding protein NELL2-like isoform X1 [Tachypleus tridentatus]|uniref:protein kinase C-binding protein NELL2-like isoform X1 n=1 Tax=Tachypleus tridentatus TaxID=6853 RepID=UPI003FD34D71
MNLKFIQELETSTWYFTCRHREMFALMFMVFITEVTVINTAAGLQIEPSHQIDLIDGLDVLNFTYRGLTLVEGFHKLAPAVKLTGDNRQLVLPPESYVRAAKILSLSNEFTFMVTLKQKQRNTGTVFGFSAGNARFLEIQSSGRKNEIRLHYTHGSMVYVETFPYRIADDNWHQVALSVSGNVVDLFVDCNHIYKRVIFDVDRNATSRNTSLWLGQRNLHHFLFQGILQDVKIVGRPHGYIIQCPHLDTDCPTCGQFKQLQMSVVHLENYMKTLTERILQAEERLALLEECECHKNCHVNKTVHMDGSSWEVGCDICSCVKGTTTCHNKPCIPTQCKNPVQLPGECCPICLKKCLMDGEIYDHGEGKKLGNCQKCYCNNGNMICERKQECPPLSCPVEDSFIVEGECCKVCKGIDYCSKGHDCHINANCSNLYTRYICHCTIGYQGDGKHCEDVNECLQKGGHTGHHCRENTRCVNLPGTYACECLPGYRRVDAYYCEEHNECLTGEHDCGANALCINTVGSYKCQCLEGYSGNGYSCDPICNQTCLNGGNCVGPNICSCRQGYAGPSCELDIDECKLGIHHCHPNSECINMPGWYYCHCHFGYESHLDNNHSGITCQDVNECADNSSTCHRTAVCVNDEGSYHCECQKNSTCSLSCIYYGTEKSNGDTWLAADSICTECFCKAGVVTCQKQECDCNKPDIDLGCCPECDTSSYCRHQEVSKLFRNGERWVYQCQICECLFGEIDCWELECPPVTCDYPVLHEGDCCYRCEDDVCSSQTFSRDEVSGNATSNQHHDQGCTYKGYLYQSGESIPINHDPCTSCNCKDGQLCCSYTPTCLASFGDTDVLPSTDKYKHIKPNFIHNFKQYLFKEETTQVEDLPLFTENYVHTSSPFSKLLLVAKSTQVPDSQMADHHIKVSLKISNENNPSNNHGNIEKRFSGAKDYLGNKEKQQDFTESQESTQMEDSGKNHQGHSKEWVNIPEGGGVKIPILFSSVSEVSDMNSE